MAKSEPKGKIEAQKASEADEIKDCFIITPIGNVESDTFTKADGLIKSVIEPVLREFGYRAVPAYEIDATGSITKQIIDHIFRDELVIANLTGNNPNVMYELAIRHAFGKKVISMAEHGTKLPFDISDQRTIFYHDSLSGSEVAKPKLRGTIASVLQVESTQVSNPIFDAIRELAVVKSVALEEQDVTKYLLERFDRIERLISNGPRHIRQGSVGRNIVRLLPDDSISWVLKIKHSGSEDAIDIEISRYVEKFSMPDFQTRITQDGHLIVLLDGRFIEADIIANSIKKLPGVHKVDLYENASPRNYDLLKNRRNANSDEDGTFERL